MNSTVLRSVTFVLLILAAPVNANSSNLQREVEELCAKSVAPDLLKSGVTDVAIETVIWADGRRADASPAIVEALAGALSRHGFRINPKAEARILVTLSGPDADPSTRQPAVRISATFQFGNVRKLVGTRRVFGEEAMVTLLAPPSLLIPPQTEAGDRALLIVNAAKQPTASDPAPPPQFHLEMHFSQDGGAFRLRPAVNGFVRATEFETYRLVFRNEENFDVVVGFSIDSLAFDHFSDRVDDKDDQNRLVFVPSKSQVCLKGWYKNERESYAFDLMALPTTAAARKSEVGVVQANVYPAWKSGGVAPNGEERSHRGATVYTAAARVQQDEFRTIPMQVGRLRASFSLRYQAD